MIQALDWLELLIDTDWLEELLGISLKMLTDNQSARHVMAQHVVHYVHLTIKDCQDGGSKKLSSSSVVHALNVT